MSCLSVTFAISPIQQASSSSFACLLAIPGGDQRGCDWECFVYEVLYFWSTFVIIHFWACFACSAKWSSSHSFVDQFSLPPLASRLSFTPLWFLFPLSVLGPCGLFPGLFFPSICLKFLPVSYKKILRSAALVEFCWSVLIFSQALFLLEGHHHNLTPDKMSQKRTNYSDIDAKFT